MGSSPIAMSTLQEDAEQEFLARLDEVLEREATARKQLEQKISARFNAVMGELVGRLNIQPNSLANSANRSANGGQEESAADDIQSGNFRFQCRLLEHQVATLCAAVSTLADRCPEEATVPTCIRGQVSLSGRSNSLGGDSFDGNATLDPLTATAVFANVALDEPQQLCHAASHGSVNCEIEEIGSAITEISDDGKHCWQKHARSAG